MSAHQGEGMNSKARVRYLDGLRAVAAIWVVCNHAWLTIYPTDADNPRGIGAVLTTWMVYGHYAVVAFIVISGYSLAISTSRHDHRLDQGFRNFLQHRFRRIVLPYWGALLISLVLAVTVVAHDTGTHWDSALPVTTRGVLLHLTLLQDLATTGQINHAMWSIAIEWHIYFLFPLVLWLRRRLGLPGATGVIVTIGVIISSRFTGGLTVWAEANLIGCFAIGVAAREIVTLSGRVPLTRSRSIRLPWGMTAAALTAGLVGLDAAVSPGQPGNTVTEPLVAITMGCLLVALAGDQSRWLQTVLSGRALTWIGTFSYSIYLLHAPVLQLVWQYIMRPLGLPQHDGYALITLLSIGIPASLGIGWAYYRAIERRYLPNRARRSKPAIDAHRC